MCCDDFKAHLRGGSAQDGFWVWVSLWKLPYTVKMVRLFCEVPGEQKRSLPIRFCPWCGRDLEVTEPAPSASDVDKA
jgi:hypothetical protein